jgi:hypothetical protein
MTQSAGEEIAKHRKDIVFYFNMAVNTYLPLESTPEVSAGIGTHRPVPVRAEGRRPKIGAPM